MSEKIAPVQGYAAGIPWSMHLRAYDAYCKKYGQQHALIDLEGRNCRGGFGVGELDMFIPGWREELSEMTRLRAENDRLRATLRDIAEFCSNDASALGAIARLASIRNTADQAVRPDITGTQRKDSTPP